MMQGRAYEAPSSVDINTGLGQQGDISSLPAAAGKATSKIEAALGIHSTFKSPHWQELLSVITPSLHG
jgi:hypothetical protein